MTNDHGVERDQTASAPTLTSISIENIEKMRQREGIDDQELHDEIGKLRVGDLIRLTLMISPHSNETVTIRVTEKNQHRFKGTLANPALNARLRRFTNGMTLNFTAEHIHSIDRLKSDTSIDAECE